MTYMWKDAQHHSLLNKCKWKKYSEMLLHSCENDLYLRKQHVGPSNPAFIGWMLQQNRFFTEPFWSLRANLWSQFEAPVNRRSKELLPPKKALTSSQLTECWTYSFKFILKTSTYIPKTIILGYVSHSLWIESLRALLWEWTMKIHLRYQQT